MKNIMVGICSVITVNFVFTGCKSPKPVNVEPVETSLDTIRVTISDEGGYVVFEPAASFVLPARSSSVTESLYLFPLNLEVSVIAKPQAGMEFVS